MHIGWIVSSFLTKLSNQGTSSNYDRDFKRGYNMIFFFNYPPWEINILLYLHPINAYALASHILHRITRCPLAIDFVYKTMKSTRYSHESRETITSSKNISFLTLNLSLNSRMIRVGWRYVNLSCFMACSVIMLMVTPRSTKVLGPHTPLIYTETIGFPG